MRAEAEFIRLSATTQELKMTGKKAVVVTRDSQGIREVLHVDGGAHGGRW